MTGPEDIRVLSGLVVDAVLRAADPGAAVKRAWTDPAPGPVFLAAFGKASVGMGNAAARRLGDRLIGGVVIAVPERVGDARVPDTVDVLAADHPLPTERNIVAARTLLSTLSDFARTNPGGTVICLVSGGGSAHLTLPAEGIALADVRAVNDALQRAGAPIGDLNQVRKHTEQLKGGRLAAAAMPARVESYIMSDVIGDALDAIASGPTAPDPSTFAGAIAVLARWGCRGASPLLTSFLERGVRGEVAETPKPSDPSFMRVRNTVIASNRVCVEAVRDAMAAAGLRVVSVEHGVEGEASEAGRRLARSLASSSGPRPACVVAGGETTVTVGKSPGRGGPSQELALACGIELERLGFGDRAGVIAVSSDGVDGPTDAAGAVLTGADIARARSSGLDADRALEGHDSHTLLDRLGALIRTGPTGTNVNHVAVGVVLA